MPQLPPTDPAAWLHEYGDILYRYALIRVRSEPTAEDMVQETLLAGFQSFEKFTGQSSVKTWLIGILKHKIIDHFRKNQLTTSLDDGEMGEDLLAYQFNDQGHWKVNLVEWVTPDQLIDDVQFWQTFHHCLARLPENMADLFMLRAMEGLSGEECCKVLNIATTNQLCVALSRTRMKLRQCLETNWFGHE